jgi:cell division topological specificity factor
MSLLKYIRGRRKSTANVAKERLQIIISHERSERDDSNYLIEMQKEILDVITKYVEIDREQVKVQVGKVGENAVLELNVTMPEKALEEA